MTLFNYPLHLRFRLIAFAPRIIVTDSTGQQVAFVHQNMWKLKEDVRIYTDESKSREIYRINADRILDISAKYYFTESHSGKALGYVRPRALRSIWRAHYPLYDETETITHFIREDNPWVKVADALFSELPFVGMFTGYVFHPSYTAYRGSDYQQDNTTDNEGVMRLDKLPGFFEGVFQIDALAPMTPQEETRLLLAFMLMVQFQRRRG